MDCNRHASFLQTNLNHCAGAQDLLLQSLAQWQVHVAVACEPYFVPPHSNWAGDLDSSVAVVVRMGVGPPLVVIEKGAGYVVVSWGEYTIIGVYFSPNRSLAEFEIFLDSVRAAVSRRSPGPIVVLGDFNAKSRAWGCPVTDGRGEAVQVWGLLSGLSLLNMGTAHTCVRHNGGSVVDLSFASPVVARRVVGWRVEEGVETLSDHLYVRFERLPSYEDQPTEPEERTPDVGHATGELRTGREPMPNWRNCGSSMELPSELYNWP
ncbi:uncharacterized protein LOC142984972 [Anticarsia gemmatalis]|uniref:uncharacterized protein LOC142984972 n=1 Tax=Anticarsia gemmatalis TaxID=129554 RepID=UPI003F7574C0